jgi:hypothetical protein
MRVAWSPLPSARDHQMDDEKEIVLQLENDAFTHPAHPGDALAVRRGNRWID